MSAAKTVCPPTWEIPAEIRVRLSDKLGRQRTMAAEGHVVVVAHRVPEKGNPQRVGVLLWRDASGGWHSTEGGPGLSPLAHLLEEYQAVVGRLEQAHDETANAEDWFSILEEVGPVHRAVRNLYEVLQRARQEISVKPSAELQAACDLASDLAREAELLQFDAKNGLDFLIAKQAEIQSRYEGEAARAGHRLNILAATFLPLALVTGVFGMNNLPVGFDDPSGGAFWFVLLVGALFGVVLAGLIVTTTRSHRRDTRRS